MSTRTVYIKTALLGGTTDAVDGIDGDTLLDGDVCHAYVSDVAYQYVLDDDSGATESSPDVIAPDLNAGDKRWILQTSAHISDDAYAAGWDGDTTHAPSKNAVYDKVQALISDAAYSSDWDGVTGVAPSKNAVYDKIEAMISDDAYAAGWGSDTTHAASKKAIYDEIETLMKLDGSNLAIGSDADGDMYYRASGVLARLAKGAANLKQFMNAAGTAPEWDTGIKVLSFTRDMTAATGDVSYSGFGFKPSAILVLTVLNNQDNMSIGIADASLEYAIVRRASNASFVSRSNIAVYEPDTANHQRAGVKSWDADGVTFTWTKTASPTGTLGIYMLAWR